MIILLYHQVNSISPDRDPLRLSVTPDQFAEQMDYLKKNDYICVSLDSIIGKNSFPEKTFAITFDDGYADNFEFAVPILQRYDFTATVFLVTNRIGNTVNWAGAEEQNFSLMNWEQIHEMAENGFQFGSHTHTHPNLKECSEQELDFELEKSKSILEKELGVSVALFAYPYESVSTDLEDRVSKAGYQIAFGSLLQPEGRFNMWRRECFGSDSMNDFRFKLSDNWRRSILFKYHSPVGNLLRSIKRRIKQ